MAVKYRNRYQNQLAHLQEEQNVIGKEAHELIEKIILANNGEFPNITDMTKETRKMWDTSQELREEQKKFDIPITEAKARLCEAANQPWCRYETIQALRQLQVLYYILEKARNCIHEEYQKDLLVLKYLLELGDEIAKTEKRLRNRYNISDEDLEQRYEFDETDYPKYYYDWD